MKKMAAIWIALLMMFSACALALTGSGYPAFDGVELPDDRFGGSFGNERLLLTFDPSPDYSSLEDGMLQLCFFAFDADRENCLELYLLLPEDLSASDGSPVSTASVYFYESSKSGEVLYFASQEGERKLPEGSNLKITLDRVEIGADAISAGGMLEGLLFAYRDDVPTGEMLDIRDAHFDFTLPMTQSGPPTPQPSIPPRDAQDTPEPTAAPKLPASPAFTLPPEYAKA